jgi:hypothetical protein
MDYRLRGNDRKANETLYAFNNFIGLSLSLTIDGFLIVPAP